MERFSQLDEFSPLRCGYPEVHGADALAEAPTDPAIEIAIHPIEDGDLCDCGDLDVMTYAVCSSCESFGQPSGLAMECQEPPPETFPEIIAGGFAFEALLILCGTLAIAVAAALVWFLT